MRTTLEIRDDIFERMKEYASARSISNGAAATEIMERGLDAPFPTKWENGLLVFDPGPNAEVITLERTLQLENELEDDPS